MARSTRHRKKNEDEGQPDPPVSSGYLHRRDKPDLPSAFTVSNPRQTPRRPPPAAKRDETKHHQVENLKRLSIVVVGMVAALFMAVQILKIHFRASQAGSRNGVEPRAAVAAKPDAGAETKAVALTDGEIIRQAAGLLEEGKQLEREGREFEALRKYLMAAKVWPPIPEALGRAGRIYAARGDHDKAITTLKRALQQDPSRIDLKRDLGISYMEDAQWELAYDALKEVLQLEPEHVEAQYAFARCLLVMGKTEDGRQMLKRYLGENGMDPEAWRELAVVDAGAGRYEEAISSLQEAIRLAPDWSTLHLDAGAAYALMGKEEEAIASLRHAETLANPVEVYSTFRNVAFEELRASEAGKAYEAELVRRARKSHLAAVAKKHGEIPSKP